MATASTAGLSAVGSSSRTATSDLFVDLLCELLCMDDELLSAEFDAIVANWDGDEEGPPSRDSAVGTGTVQPTPFTPVQLDDRFAPTGRVAATREGAGRQRSPPG
ncbi:MAG TPA: hypothetical protein VLL08_09845 [Kineosporiaceae bacterium]|nr:hypothetical protein [Kineosporiaceae bacterium]